MINILSDSLITPLGFCSEENYQNVKLGKTGIKTYSGILGVDKQVSCSKIDDILLDSEFEKQINQNSVKYTRLEKAALLSVKQAVDKSEIDVTSCRTAFFFSSTKGNVELLEKNSFEEDRLYLWHTAKMITDFFKNPNIPIVVSNACISGICSIISASRAIESGRFDNAVIVGADVLSKFTISGFSCLKALSPEPCKPFDKDRKGLNLGEAAATMILSRGDVNSKYTSFLAGSIRNDANHISGPSRTAEGAYNALTDILTGFDTEQIAFVSTHGTATFFNDEMESIAIDRMKLNNKPINAFKGYYGHTLGAAGILEAVIASHSINDNTVLKTRGFENLGVSREINPTRENLVTDKPYFVKLISGFGGTNAAAIFKKGE